MRNYLQVPRSIKIALIVTATVAFLAPTAAFAALSSASVVSGSQTPNPVVRGSSATFTADVVNDNGSTQRAVSITAISHGPTGVTLASSSCVLVPGDGNTHMITFTLNTTTSTATGTATFAVTATRWENTTANCSGTVDDTQSSSNTSGSIVVSAAVSKTNPTLSVTNSPVIYTGSAQSAAVSGSVAGTVSNVEYSGTSTVPTKAGTYTITANFVPTDTTDYNSLTNASAGSFTINKATPTVSITNSPVTYTGSAQPATLSESTVGAVSNLEYSGSSTAPKNAGTYAVTLNFTPTDTTDYNNLTATSAGNLVINKATSNTNVVGGTFTYSGDSSAHPATVSVTGAGGLNLTPSPTYSGSCTSAPITVAQGTSCTASYTFSDSNHSTSTSSAIITVTPASLTVTATGENKVYDGTTTATVVLGDDRIAGDNITDSYTDAEFADPNVATGISVSVNGISISGTDSGNYTLANTTASTIADITQNSATITLDTSNLNPTFDGTDQSVDVVSTNPSGLSYEVTYNGSNTPPTDAGTYTVLATITDPNYSGTDNQTLTIGPAQATVSVTPYVVTYDGNAYTASGTATGVSAVDLSSYLNLASTTETTAGTYNDSWTFDAGNNYTTQSGTATDTINQATPVLSVTNSPVQYDGSDHSADVDANVAGTVSNILTGASSSQSDVGTYPVVADFSPTDSTDYQSLSAASAGDFDIVSSTSDLITGFTFGLGDNDIIGSDSVDVTVPFGTDVTSLTPTITLSTGATVDPLSGVTEDFSSPVNYTVTAQDGITTQQYTVTVTVSPFTPNVGGGSETYTIDASASAGGSISPSGLATFSPGNNQTFTIVPSTGYQISGVTVDGGSVGTVASYTFSSINGDHTISATFSQIATTPGTSTSTSQGQVLGISTSTPSTGQVLGTSTFFFANNLGLGMSSNDVKQLQIRLTAEGVYSGPITGYFGKLTFAGVEKYQTQSGIVWVTGWVGPITRGMLNGLLPLNSTPAQQLSYLESQLP